MMVNKKWPLRNANFVYFFCYLVDLDDGGDENSEEVAEQEQLVTQGWRGTLLLQVRANHHVNHPMNKQMQKKSKSTNEKQTNKQGEQANF